MYCPKCKPGDNPGGIVLPGQRTRVVDSRLESNQIVRRRRLCSHCGYRFTTWESLLSPKEIETELEIRASVAQGMMDRIRTKAVIILNTLK